MDSDECKKMAGDRQDPCFSDLDRGWAWVVLVASFGCFFLIGGTMYAVGIIHIALLERYGQELSKTSVVGALHSAVMSIGAPLSTALIDRFSCRVALVTSGCLYVIGYVATAFASTIEVCIFTCGLLAGFGGAAGYTAAIVVVGFNFKHKRNLAMGLAISGIGAGMFVMAPIYEIARDYYGNSGFFIILAGLSANIIVFGMMCFPSKLEKHTQERRKQEITRKTQKKNSSELFSVVKFYIHVAFKKPVLFLCFCMFNYGLGTFLIILHLPNYAVHKGSTSIQGSFLLSICGGMGVLGRILTGIAANYEKIDEILIFSGSMGVVSLATLLFPLYSYSFAGQVVYSAIFGMYFGSCYVLTGSVNIKFVGVKAMAAAIGLEFFYCGLGAMMGPVLAGLIVDKGGTYEQSFIVSGFFLLLACILAIAAAWASSPHEEEYEIKDRELNIMCEDKVHTKESPDLLNHSKKTDATVDQLHNLTPFKQEPSFLNGQRKEGAIGWQSETTDANTISLQTDDFEQITEVDSLLENKNEINIE